MTEHENDEKQVTFGAIQKKEMEEGCTENGRWMGYEKSISSVILSGHQKANVAFVKAW